MLSRCKQRLRLPSFSPHSKPPLRLPRRYESTTKKSPTPWREELSSEPSVFIDENYAKHTLFAFGVFKRLIKFSLIGLFGTGILVWTAFEGTHMWVEKMELAPETDEETKKWEWDVDAEKWSGGVSGGTDSALGFKGRHALRSAWIAQNWGVGSSGNIMGSNAYSGKRGFGTGGLNVVEARLEYAQDFLNIAFEIALRKDESNVLKPHTVAEILVRHADVMERMGTHDGIFEARSELHRVWARLSGKGPEASRIALKLGDLNYRLGDAQDALTWWARSIHMVSGDDTKQVSPIPVIPASAPSSPSAQRTLASALVSLSAYYATSGQLRQAQTVEETALNLLRSIRPAESVFTATPPQALHALYLLHRSALISVHLAEVSYALRSPTDTCIQWLTRAAESSERVALTLTGLPRTHPDAPKSKIPHPPSSESPLLPVFSKSQSMKKPAKSLLRDARRSATEAWNLIGVLSEGKKDPSSMGKALECYERALGWAGVSTNKAGGIGQAGEGVLEAEWKVLWGNYVRVREAVRATNEK
ncbi:hypothetical protein EW146_g3067 [Bondarzewia mesenterica]|uniref:Uncharacterized protein n=1 Tax=Bondarzewia mesenterica TaxID=1095465 RepID=A0A4S4LZ55_9AGAM|nr:hypothetical protein EW146_g3067 [Bondarzewia mesenterica]